MGPGPHSQVTLDYPNITANSVVHISVCEYRSTPLANVFERFIGDATISVANIQPRDGGVSFLLNIGWNAPLTVATDITFSDDPLEFIGVDEGGTLVEIPSSGAG
jgi:hypothetical protein